MKYASMKYDISANLGDQIQTLAAEQFLPKVDCRINRDTMGRDGLEEPHMVILNGWFSHAKKNCFPPSKNVIPVFFGFHISDWHEGRILEYFLSPPCIAYLKDHGPVGCRDRKTMERLQDKGVNAFYSKCLTLTFPRREKDPKDGKIFLVGINKSAPLPESLDSSRVYVTHGVKDYYDDEIKISMAEHLLKMYREQAKMVITSKIHCAMPCIAMGIPVVFFGDENDYRISILRDLGVPIYSSMIKKEIREKIDWNPPPINLEPEKVEMRNKISEMIAAVTH
ncbi:MAG: polysaccharide pyruvyl transferase family protein [bacterium]